MAGAMVGAAAWAGMRSPEAAQSMRSNIRPRGAHYLAPVANRQARQSRLPRQLLQHFYPSMETEGVSPPHLRRSRGRRRQGTRSVLRTVWCLGTRSVA